MSEPKRLRILFDGVEINETPDGWQDITSTIKRLKEINSLFITTEAELTFMDDGYDYLIALFDDSFTNKVLVELQEYCGGVYESFFTGTIFISSATVDRKNCTIKVNIEDNSFYAKINNNKGLEVFPFASQTKNAGQDPTDTQYYITPCAFEKVQFFDPIDGTYLGVPVAGYSGASYPVYNLFEYLISFMTDNTMGFESSLFGGGGDYEGLVVTCGIAIRQYYGGVGTTEQDFKSNFQKISFAQLFSEVNKKINIGMIVDYSGPLPKIKIERVSDLRSSATSFQAVNIDELNESIDSSQLYASVRLGSGTVSEKANTSSQQQSFPEGVSFVGFKEEQFIVLGECNIDAELNLVSDWIVSSNIIEDIFINGESDYDDNLIFVMCDISGGNYIARQSNLEDQSGAFPVFYNLDLNGAACMDNYFGAVPVSIAQYLGDTDNTFRASATADTPYGYLGGAPLDIFPVVFDNDTILPNFDTSGNYDNTTYYYTAPLSGLYVFDAGIYVRFLVDPANSGAEDYYIECSFERYDTIGGTLISSSNFYAAYNIGVNGVFIDIAAVGSKNVVVDLGEVVAVKVRLASNGSGQKFGAILLDSYFSAIASADGGGQYKTFDPADYPVYRHQWEYPLTLDEYKNIQQNQTAQIQFSRYGEKNYSGWIDSIKFKRFGDEKAKFITYRAKSIPITSNEPPEIRNVHIVAQLADLSFDLSPDLYGNPWGGSDSTNKVYFYFSNSNAIITAPATYLGCDFLWFYITRFPEVGAISSTVINTTTTSFLVEPKCNYIVQVTYDLTQLGNTWPSVLPEITPPVTAGLNGTANIRLVSPATLADYTFLWSTGATTQSINAPAGDYTCAVTYVPATFDNNIFIFNIQIPVSETGQ